MRIQVLIFSFLAICLNTYAQQVNPFLNLRFDKVIVSDYESDGEHSYPLVDKNGILTNIVKKSRELDKQTISTLNIKLGDKKSYGQVQADCFEPHFGILYYKMNKVVAQIEICLSCNVLSSSIEIPAQKQGKQGKGDKAYYLGNGMSKSFRKFINSIVKKYNFSHQIQPGSHFDK